MVHFRKILITILLLTFLTSCQTNPATAAAPKQFDSKRAFTDLTTQMGYGPRIPGSQAHQDAEDYICSQLRTAGWKVEIQEATDMGHPVANIVAKRSNAKAPIILGAHYDSRMIADQDPDPTLRSQPVPGADDGASGVAVLLEIARVLPPENKNVWLVFFDSEDQGQIKGWDWLLGSTVYAKSLKLTPNAVVVIDMIGDKDLNIYREISSTKSLSDEIWQTAASLGYSTQFIDSEKYSMLDDQTPFLDRGFPAVDIIDFDYPYWHTTSDTTDKVSAASLEIVGDTLLEWLKSNQ